MKFHHETPDRSNMPIQGNTYMVSREGKALFTALIQDYKPASCWAEVQILSAQKGYEEYYPLQTTMRLKVALYEFAKE
ncbi:MAG: hypothetical protein ACO3DH_07395 [Candidatus Kapaibacteriota bacterium]|jgi:hypothetical protein